MSTGLSGSWQARSDRVERHYGSAGADLPRIEFPFVPGSRLLATEPRSGDGSPETTVAELRLAAGRPMLRIAVNPLATQRAKDRAQGSRGWSMPCSGKAVVDAYPPPADPRTTAFWSLTGPQGSPWARSRAAYGPAHGGCPVWAGERTSIK